MNVPRDIPRSIFVGHLIARPERVYPTSHITDQEQGVDGELLLKNLTTFESMSTREGFDIYHLGYRMNVGSHINPEYQDPVITHLRTQGLVPTHGGGYTVVEPCRARRESRHLRPKRDGLT